jgi:HSP20 family protein
MEGQVMSLMRYEPWGLLDQMRRELERSMDTRTAEGSSMATSDWVPAVDIKEEENDFLIVADIPGVDPKDIEVHMDNGVLTIKGEKESEKKEEREGYKRVERSFGSFYRRFALPDTADPDKITAKSNNGVLELRIGKQEKVQPRKISVSS